MRYTTFRLAMDPTPAQAALLARHAGASRFAYNQCLRLVNSALRTNNSNPLMLVPWSGFDLINAFNTWKRSEEAGRVFVVGSKGTCNKQVTGLAWRHEVTAQVFEEAAVDLGRALAAYTRARVGTREGGRVGFPKAKRKGRCRDSFRIRNKRNRNGTHCIRVGDSRPRSITLPTIGTVRVHDDTRRLRRLLRTVRQLDPNTGQPVVGPRAKILFATCSRHGSRWYVSLNLQAPDFHSERHHPAPLCRRPWRVRRPGSRLGHIRGGRYIRWYRGRSLAGAQADAARSGRSAAAVSCSLPHPVPLTKSSQGGPAVVPAARPDRPCPPKLPA
jgi:putative transposase